MHAFLPVRDHFLNRVAFQTLLILNSQNQPLKKLVDFSRHMTKNEKTADES